MASFIWAFVVLSIRLVLSIKITREGYSKAMIVKSDGHLLVNQTSEAFQILGRIGGYGKDARAFEEDLQRRRIAYLRGNIKRGWDFPSTWIPQLSEKGVPLKGNYGEVYLVNLKCDPNILVAVKQQKAKDQQESQLMMQEIGIMKQLQDPHFVSIWADEKVGFFFDILMEGITGGSLQEYQEQRTNEKVDPWDKTVHPLLFLDMAKGVSIMHKKGIVHRDLKPENVMLTSTTPPRAKLIDVGLACRISHCTDFVGTPFFTPPEVASELLKESQVSEVQSGAFDIWSLGVILYELHFGELPFKANSFNQLYKQILAFDIDERLEAHGGLDERLKTLLKNSLRKAPGERWNALQIVDETEAWIRELKNDTLTNAMKEDPESHEPPSCWMVDLTDELIGSRLNTGTSTLKCCCNEEENSCRVLDLSESKPMCDTPHRRRRGKSESCGCRIEAGWKQFKKTSIEKCMLRNEEIPDQTLADSHKPPWLA